MNRLSYIFSLGAFMGSLNCASYPYAYQGTGSVEIFDNETKVTSGMATDILFVVDNSGSMADKQQDLMRNAQFFIDALTHGDADYHLGVVTTDFKAPTDGGRLRMASGDQKFLTSPAPDDPDADAKRQAIVSSFAATVQSVGLVGSGNEAGLGAALAAVSADDPNVAAYNAGFLRAEADLAVVILSDEDDCSPTAATAATVATWTGDSTCYQQTQFLNPVDDMVKAFTAIKGGDVSRVRLAFIGGGIESANDGFSPRGCIAGADGKPSDHCGCWTISADPYFCASLHQEFSQPCQSKASCTNNTCPSSIGGTCDTPVCPATPARRYNSFLTALDAARSRGGYNHGTLANSICQADYHETLVKIAEEVVLSNCFSLPTTPLGKDDVAVQRTRQTTETLPRYDAQDPSAGCTSCDACPNGAWAYSAPRTICLACGAHKQFGDNYRVSVVNNASGVFGNDAN